MKELKIDAVKVRDVEIGSGRLAVIAGPCVFESLELGIETGSRLKEICAKLGFGYIFKASFDKANRTSLHGYRGPGIDTALEWLAAVKKELGVPVLTDVHEPGQAEKAAEVADMLQIPAFLCRQTDLLIAAAETGKPVNVKKAQFLAPEDMAPVVQKLRESGASGIVLCERGTSFGYHQLVVDFRSLTLMRSLGVPVMFDATHSVQQPGGRGSSSGGDRRYIPSLIRSACSIGIDSLFLEVHPNPDEAKSDGPNMVPLDKAESVLGQAAVIDAAVRRSIGFSSLDWAQE